MSALGRAVHLLPAGKAFRGWSTSVAVCGELVTGAAHEEEPSYCPDCVRAAIQWCAAEPVPVSQEGGQGHE